LQHTSRAEAAAGEIGYVKTEHGDAIRRDGLTFLSPEIAVGNLAFDGPDPVCLGRDLPQRFSR
jgi:hypothetical protein